uniref:Uncharacterized protein n=1 Tax=Leersia perrieri TaxID=77586 RepID=A0A0D9V3Z4_9ORYZ
MAGSGCGYSGRRCGHQIRRYRPCDDGGDDLGAQIPVLPIRCTRASQRSRAIGKTTPKRRSPLPEWYPRSLLRDITSIVKVMNHFRWLCDGCSLNPVN